MLTLSLVHRLISLSNRPFSSRKSVKTAPRRSSMAFLLSSTTWRERATLESSRYLALMGMNWHVKQIVGVG